MKTIGIIPLARQLLLNKYSLLIIIIISAFSCSYIKGQQEKNGAQYDDLTKRYVYSFVQQMPNYKGGDIALMNDFIKSFNYYFQPNENNQTKLQFQFVVDTKGNLIGARIYGKKAESLTNFEKAGLKTLVMLKDWKPGKHNNKNVNVILTKIINVDYNNKYCCKICRQYS